MRLETPPSSLWSILTNADAAQSASPAERRGANMAIVLALLAYVLLTAGVATLLPNMRDVMELLPTFK
jgi:hypothetical protein